MRASQLFFPTLRETPNDAEIVSHQLMLRAGFIRKVSGGLYTWLPLGLRVLRKIEAVIREEMHRIGAQEILMPTIQPASLWEETGRFEKFGPQLLKMEDRAGRKYCFGPTAEEVVTDLFRNEVQSYKSLPLCFYQIQTKFRDEIRPRFGVMRAREFLMKDAYSFHINPESLQQTYEAMHDAYSQILRRLQLNFRAVLADTGAIGGSASQEFHVLADSGEDALAISDSSDYAANVETATAFAPTPEKANLKPIEKVACQNSDVVAQAAHLGVSLRRVSKTLLVKGKQCPAVALVIAGDHRLNEIKVSKLEHVAEPFTMLHEAEAKALTHCELGFIGALGLSIPVIVDREIAALNDFVMGANETNVLLKNVNVARDFPRAIIADIRNVEEGDRAPDGQGTLRITRGIEVGHIFQLGDKYSQAMQATVLDEAGKNAVVTMGCYGIGVSRLVAAAIEQHHDEKGIVWPKALAPFHIAIVPVCFDKSEAVQRATLSLYDDLRAAGFEVLLDDRGQRPGVSFADIDLIGIPHRIVVSEKSLAKNEVEYKGRCMAAPEMWPLQEALIKFKDVMI